MEKADAPAQPGGGLRPAAWLLVLKGPNAGEALVLVKGLNVLGRDLGKCEAHGRSRQPNGEPRAMVVPDPKASRVHCEVLTRGGSFRIKDLGSTNKTWINENECTPNQEYPLTDRCRVSVAHTDFLFVVHPRLLDKNTVAPPGGAGRTEEIEVPKDLAGAKPAAAASVGDPELRKKLAEQERIILLLREQLQAGEDLARRLERRLINLAEQLNSSTVR